MKAVFFRVLEAKDKEAALKAAVQKSDPSRFEVDLERFTAIPTVPLCYWAPDGLIDVFRGFLSLSESGRLARTTNPTTDDFRFARAFWEVPPAALNTRWRAWNKGGGFNPYYRDIDLVIHWDERRQTYLGYLGTIYRPDIRPANLDYFFRPGLTWGYRGHRMCVQAMPRGVAISTRGNGIYADEATRLFDLGLLNSLVADFLVKLSLGRGGHPQFDIGDINNIPVPRYDQEVAQLAARAWSLRRGMDTRDETTHAFALPALLQVAGANLMKRAEAWAARVKSAEGDLDRIQETIDELCFDLYGIEDEDRRQIEIGFDTPSDGAEPEDDEGDAEPEELEKRPLVESLLSWVVGVAFGRFDVRLATQDRKPPPEPEPFDPLPPCSPAMLTGDDGLPLEAPPSGYPLDVPSDGILADDAGHDRDVVARMRHVFELLFGQEADAVWREAAEILDPRRRDVRGWVARSFFEQHIKRYSKSRRMAPIYWQLSTASASYSVWLYLHRFTKDTLYKVLNDFAEPKLRHEERKLASLTQEAGGSPTSSQRKELDAQANFVEELRSFRDEVARIAPLWNPNLDDGVVINFAPLWRLVPQHRGWQKECRKVWDKLCKGEYDWAHLAMHLWPERVVPKCRKDRSLAIAHGLEDVFWEENSDGKWQPRKVDPATVDRFIEERTSAAVRDARQSVLDAPAPARGGSKSRNRRTTKGRRSKEGSKGGAT